MHIIELFDKYFYIKCCFTQVRKFQKVSCLHFYQWVYYCCVEKLSNFSIKVWTKGTLWKIIILTPKTYIDMTFYEHSMQFQKNQFAFAGVLPLRISRKRKPCSEYIPYFEKKGETKYCTLHNWVKLFLKEAFIFSSFFVFTLYLIRNIHDVTF